MDCSHCEGIQEPVNHMPSKYAPKPREPAASQETSTPAVGVLPGKSQKIDPMPIYQELMPPLQITMELLIKADRVVLLVEAAEQVNHAGRLKVCFS